MSADDSVTVYEDKRLKVSVSAQPGRAVWRFEGEASAKVEGLKDLLDSFVDQMLAQEEPILRGARYVSSPFIGLLVRLVARLADRGQILELWGPSDRILDLLGIVGIAESMKVHGAEEDPLAEATPEP